MMRADSMQLGQLRKDGTGNSDNSIQFESEENNSGMAEVLGKGAGTEEGNRRRILLDIL